MAEEFPVYDHKPALMRAYKAADRDGDGLVAPGLGHITLDHTKHTLYIGIVLHDTVCLSPPGRARGVPRAAALPRLLWRRLGQGAELALITVLIIAELALLIMLIILSCHYSRGYAHYAELALITVRIMLSWH